MIWDVIFWGVIISISAAILLKLFYFIVIAPTVYESEGFWGLLIYVLTTIFLYVWDFAKYIIGIVILVFILSLLTDQFSKKTIHKNDIALKLKKLESEGVIRQSDDKDIILEFFEENLIDQFTEMGFGHRINETKKTWNVYEDNGYLILTGGLAKTDEIYMFAFVYKEEETLIFTPVYAQIGQEKKGTYPEKIIPYRKKLK